ncbi:MAG: FAD-dependent oxidoreductase [Bifidobacteriaceae bacterium]|jgi:NADPH-dependent 2,4-dienoyl-CoA reductase/sulfur reductase-like enzyme|nr:FAD-dependent oxidoreductase [Bifidobacteriaceae bacterium]MCI1914886.1 FAD-dependent oxidoreductase [Bifidobacteriaceae bacterium]
MRVAVIGCTHAGVFSTQSILGEHPDWEVNVYERNTTVSFLSCGIALWVGDHVSDPQKMFYSSPQALEQLGAHVFMQHDVLSANLATKTLEVKDLVSGEVTTEVFDKIVVTTGSKPVVPPIPGVELDRVLLCKNWDDGQRIKETAANAESVVVVGAGYIGAELAEQFNSIGVKVTLIDALPRVLANNFDADVTDRVEQSFENHGVALALGQKVLKIDDRDNGSGVTVETDTDSFDADYVILAAGFAPRTDLFTGQVDMLGNGAIVVDDYLRTSVPDVFAAGDSATVTYNPTGKPDYIPLATNAVRQGLVLGHNMVEPKLKHPGTQSSSAVQLFELSMASTGLSIASAQRRGVQLETTTLVQDYRPDFMLTTTPVTCVLTWDKETRLVKGAQFLAKHDISQAANVVSLAIANKMTIDDLSLADFLFQPNFDQPVNYVAAVALQASAQ